MKFILKNTDPQQFEYLAAGGSEPLREYGKTISLLRARLADSFPGFADMLATPTLLPDGKTEWSTNRFNTLPRPLDTLKGEEREYYAALLAESMAKLKKAIDTLRNSGDNAADIFDVITVVPSPDAIYCADKKIVIAEWGLRPKAGGSGLSLLSFADTAEEAPEPKPEVVTDPKVVADDKPKEVKEEKPEIKKEEKPEIKKEEKKEEIVVDPPLVPPFVHDNHPAKKKKKRSWLWILLALLAAGLITFLVLFLTRCSSAETVAKLPQQPPEIKKENVVLTSDSMAYIVNDRLNVMVLGGGSLDDFIRDFRKQYPDKEKYAIFMPDTTFNSFLLQVDPAEREGLIKEIPAKMAPDYKVIVASEGITEGSYVPSDPAMKVPSQSYYFDMINAPEAWDIQKGDPNIVIAVLDDGFDLSHPELQGKVVDAYDIYRNKPGTTPSSDGHGQHTSATAAGNADNGSGACGVAPGCKVMPINVFSNNGAPTSCIVRGLAYAANKGAKVISMSIGQAFGPQVKFLPVEVQKEMAQMIMPDVAQMYDEIFRVLDEMGITVVIAAGNETVLAELDPMNRSQYPIIVSACDPDGDIAIFQPNTTLDGSNWGERCDISAPGLAIYNAVPGGYDFKQGTSMACPQVAGGAALVLSQFPNLTPQEVKQLLVTTAVPIEEHIGPLMDLAAALKANPDAPGRQPGVSPSPSPAPAPSPEPDRGKRHRYTDPYEFFYSDNPTPSPRRPDPNNPDDPDCGEVSREIQRLQQRIDNLKKKCPQCA